MQEVGQTLEIADGAAVVAGIGVAPGLGRDVLTDEAAGAIAEGELSAAGMPTEGAVVVDRYDHRRSGRSRL